MSIPILVVGDGAHLPTGLGRIARDLLRGLHGDRKVLDIEVAQLAWDHDDSQFSWRSIAITDHANWGKADLPLAWWKLFGNRRGMIFTVWDPARCFELTAGAGEVPATLAGYFAIDAINANGTLGGPAAAVARRYRHVLGYGRWGAEVLKSIVGGEQQVQYLPHGINFDTFKPYASDQELNMVGCVMANIPRKDFAMLFQVWSLLAQWDASLTFWLHTNYEVTQHWSVPELMDSFPALESKVILTGPRDRKAELSDDQLAQMYSRCLCTILPSGGEGFGYPIVESMACGTPVLHLNYAGGAELIPFARFRPQPQSFRLEGSYVLQRPNVNEMDYFTACVQAITMKRTQPETASYLRGSVQHLSWSALWPRWRSLFANWLEELR